MAPQETQIVKVKRKLDFERATRTALIFVLIFAVSCLVSFAANRHRTAQKTAAEISDSAASEPSTPSASAATAPSDAPATKLIYLTFDDGPGQYTERLLDLLKKYDVKATFFTTSMYPNYAELIKREAAEGHSVAIHSYSHNYEKIYASSTAFWNDFDAQQKVILNQTGKETKLMRFPGGSSNTVSDFTPGIMTTLVEQTKAKGLVYVDWNVSSGDAGSTTDSAVVLQNCKAGVQSHETSIILCHDVKAFTVDAMESFLPWAIENGYAFRSLSDDGPTAHHKINN